MGIGVATGAYGLSFGALAVAAGLSVPQACALSLFMFTGASQFAFVGLIGGGAGAAVATALLLGARNALYGLRLASFVRPRPLAAHFVIDESAAMAVRDDAADARLGFWATGLAVFVCWNLATLLGALGGAALSDPRALGLDAAAPAGFLALLAPQVRAREPRMIAALAAGAALLSVPLVPAGVPVLVAAAVAVAAAVVRGGEGARGGGVVAGGEGTRGGAVAASEFARAG
jgi:predicted branched-subunit amino acid permease